MAGVKEAPACLACHKTALVSVPDGAPPASAKLAQEKLCLSCHLDNADVRSRVSPGAGFIAKYEESVHGKAEVIIGKQRHGPTGTINLQFDASVTRFGDLAHDSQLPERY